MSEYLQSELLCKKRTKPATQRVLHPATKNARHPATYRGAYPATFVA